MEWRIRVLAILDDFTRVPLALVVDTWIDDHRVAREFDAVIARRCRRDMTESDNGNKLTSHLMLDWMNRT